MARPGEVDRKRNDPRREPTDPDIRLDQKDIDRAKKTLEQLARHDDDTVPPPPIKRSLRPAPADITTGELTEHLTSLPEGRRRQIDTLVKAGQFARALAMLDEEKARFPRNVSISYAISSVREIASRTYAARLNRLEMVPMIGRPQALEGHMSDGVRMVVRAIDGVSSFEDIVRTSPLGRMKTLEVLADLFDRRVLVIKPHADSARPRKTEKPTTPISSRKPSAPSPSSREAADSPPPSSLPAGELHIPRPPRMPGSDLAVPIRSSDRPTAAEPSDEEASASPWGSTPPSPESTASRTYLALAACAVVGAIGIYLFAKNTEPTTNVETDPLVATGATSIVTPPRVPTNLPVAPTPVAPAEATTMTLNIELSPREARAFLDGEALEGTHIQRKLPRDGAGHLVRVEAHGYKKTVQAFNANADVTLVLSLELLPKLKDNKTKPRTGEKPTEKPVEKTVSYTI